MNAEPGGGAPDQIRGWADTNLLAELFPAFLDKWMSEAYIIPRIEIIPDAKDKTSESERK